MTNQYIYKSQTIASIFGITERTLQNWCKHAHIKLPKISDFKKTSSIRLYGGDLFQLYCIFLQKNAIQGLDKRLDVLYKLTEYLIENRIDVNLNNHSTLNVLNSDDQ